MSGTTVSIRDGATRVTFSGTGTTITAGGGSRDALSLRGKSVGSLSAITDGQVLAWDAASSTFLPANAGTGGGGTWGSIAGTLSAQTDLQSALDLKLSSAAAALAYQPLDADLTALAALTSTGGWAKRTGADTWSISTPSASDVGLGSVENAAASGLYVPLTRTVNGSALSSNVTISTITGNAGTATALATARAINGVSFDGTAAITVTAAAGTLTGATLASNVLTAALTKLSAQTSNGFLKTGSSDGTLSVDTATYLTAVTAHNVLSATHGDTLADTVVRGDILYGNSTPKWARLAKPSVLSGLSHDGTDVSWVTATGTGAPVRAAGPAFSGEPTIAHGTITTALSPLTITETRNASGVTFPGLVYNVTNTAAASGSMLLDLQIGGTTKFNVSALGALRLNFGTTSVNDAVQINSSGALFLGTNATGARWSLGHIAGTYNVGLNLASDALVTFYSGANIDTGAKDLLLLRAAAATLQLGQDVNGAAVSQAIQSANGITGTDKTGGNFTLASGKGTGAGAVSSVLIQTPTVAASGTTAQALATRLTIDSSGILATGYKSSDGSAGVTAGPFTTITSITVKNGLVTAITGS